MKEKITEEIAKMLLEKVRLEANTARINLAAKLLEKWL
jgi:hypothetical protein